MEDTNESKRIEYGRSYNSAETIANFRLRHVHLRYIHLQFLQVFPMGMWLTGRSAHMNITGVGLGESQGQSRARGSYFDGISAF